MTVYKIRLGNRIISPENPCYIIAEIGVNHNGDLSLAYQLIDEAKKAGADAVKFQAFKTDELVLKNAPKATYQTENTGSGSQSDMLQKLELSSEAFDDIQKYCAHKNIDFICTAFDTPSLEKVISMNPICIKWPSGELNNLPLLKRAASSGLPMLLSTGMGSINEIATALDLLRETQNENVVILQCVSNYPAAIEDQNLRTIPHMSAIFGAPVGFSDHTIGPYAAIAARALGMCVLEKHFTLDTKMEGPDHAASITPRKMAQLIRALRSVEKGLGDGVKRPLDKEENIRFAARKSLVYRDHYTPGYKISENDLNAKRPGDGISPDKIGDFVGLTLKKMVSKNDLVRREDFIT